MRFPRHRLSVRMMIGVVALVAVSLWGWRTYFDPVRLWKEAIRDQQDLARRSKGFDDAVQGQVPGVSADTAIAEFIKVLGDKGTDPTVRLMAIASLQRFKGKARAAIPTLIVSLRDESPNLRVSTAFAFWQILGDLPKEDQARRDAVEARVVALKNPDGQVRRWSAFSLSMIGEGEVAIPNLIAVLKEPDLDCYGRTQMLEALRRSGPKGGDALPTVLEMVKAAAIHDKNQSTAFDRQGSALVQIEAAKFLHAFGETGRAVEILRRLANDEDSGFPVQAASVLASFGYAKVPVEPEASP